MSSRSGTERCPDCLSNERKVRGPDPWPEEGDQACDHAWHDEKPPAPDTEVDRGEREANAAVNCMSIKAAGESGNWIDEKAALHDSISRLADLAREYERRLANGLAAAFDLHVAANHPAVFSLCTKHKCVHLRKSLSPPEGGRTP